MQIEGACQESSLPQPRGPRRGGARESSQLEDLRVGCMFKEKLRGTRRYNLTHAHELPTSDVVRVTGVPVRKSAPRMVKPNV